MPEKNKRRSSNDQILLDTLLKHQKMDRDPDSTDKEYFEYFCADQILKELDLSGEELQSGIVSDDKSDGGISAIYVVLNGKLVQDSETHNYPKQNVAIKVIVIHTATVSGFGEDVINKIIDSTRELFNAENDLDDMGLTYNPNLLEIIGVFRNVFENTASLFPEIQFDYYYISHASSKDRLQDTISKKPGQLEKTIKRLFPKSKFSFQFVGARELYETASKSSVPVVNLQLSETPISTIGSNYICLVNLADYYNFITFIDPVTGKRELLGGVFESNVRDYEGDVDVNQSIRSTLNSSQKEDDFWWLNNGVTALASEVIPSHKELTITGLQIVNGLQTSMEIYNHFSGLEIESKPIKDLRNILVRIIKSSDSGSRDRIIKATNYQTRVPPASLRATDPYQEKVEDYLLTRGYFYERRKNYYKNQGKPRKNIVSITYLAQSIVAIALQDPNNARGRPSTLLNDEATYRQIFNPNYPWEIYFECVRFMRRVEGFARSHTPPSDVDATSYNFRYHLAMFAAAMKSGVAQPKPSSISSIGLHEIDDSLLEKCMVHIWDVYKVFKKKGLSEARIMKSPEFDKMLHVRLASII